MGWIIFIGLAAAVLNWFGLVWRTKRRTKLVRRFLARHDLGVETESLLIAERILVAQARGRHVGSVVGLAVMSGLVYLDALRPEDNAPYAMAGILPVLWMVALGGAVGVQLAGRPAPDVPRVARAPQPGFDDYVQPWKRWLGPPSWRWRLRSPSHPRLTARRRRDMRSSWRWCSQPCRSSPAR